MFSSLLKSAYCEQRFWVSLATVYMCSVLYTSWTNYYFCMAVVLKLWSAKLTIKIYICNMQVIQLQEAALGQHMSFIRIYSTESSISFISSLYTVFYRLIRCTLILKQLKKIILVFLVLGCKA